MLADQATSFRGLILMFRGRAALSQRDLASALGVSERAIQVWEAGVGYPSAATLRRLIAFYASRRTFEPGAELDEALGLWNAALAASPRLKGAFDERWFETILHHDAGTSAAPVDRARIDWGEAPAVSAFHGRGDDRARLAGWLVNDHCRVVGICGMGGIGKTALAARVARDTARHFEAIFWRGLRNALPSTDWLAEAILFLSAQRTAPPQTDAERRTCLLELLRERRCLLVLDNLETVLEPGVSPLAYSEGNAGYGLVLRTIAEAEHKSCLLITSREEPPELGLLAGHGGVARVHRLNGLDAAAGRALLADKGLVGGRGDWNHLVSRYSGNPLALRMVGELIARVFSRDISAFLAAGEPMFGDIRRLLQEQVGRLSPAERSVLYWLALERAPVDVNTLVADLVPRISRGDLLDALHTLDSRSLLEPGTPHATFTLQPVVLEHATDEIIARAVSEIRTGRPDLLITNPLVKASSREYVQRTQERLVARPVLERLSVDIPTGVIQDLLLQLLERWRGLPECQQGFGPGNVVNLLRLARGDLRDLDLSHLVLRQADLRGVDAQGVNLSHSLVTEVAFAQQLGAAVSTALSSDGTHLAVGTMHGEVRVWRLADSAPVLIDRQPVGPAWAVSLSASGRLLASGGGPGSVWLWRTDGSEGRRPLEAANAEQWCVALSGNGRIVAAGAGDGTARVWRTRTGEHLHIIEPSGGGVRGVALSHNGSTLATGTAEGTIAVWRLDEGLQLVQKRAVHGEARAVALSADGCMVGAGDGEGVVHVWRVDGAGPDMILRGHSGPVWAAALNATGDRLASGGADRSLRLWDTTTGECRRVMYEHTAGVIMTSLTADAQLASSVALDGSARVWDTRQGRCLIVSKGNVAAILETAISANGRLAASGGGDGTVRIWDTTSGHCVRELRGHAAAIWGVALSQDGDLAISGALDATVRVWSVGRSQCQHILNGHTLGVTTVALNRDRTMIASGSFDGSLRLWDVATGQCLRVLRCNVAGVRTVRFNGDGSRLVSGDLDGNIRVWDPCTGKCLQVLKTGCGELAGLAVSGDGRLVAHAGPEGRVSFWDLEADSDGPVLATQAAGVRAVALSPDGRILATGGVDNTVQVWDVARATLRHVLPGHSAEVWGVAFNATGRLLTSGSLDGTLQLWDLASGGANLTSMRVDRPYERMNIAGVSGLTDMQREGMIALGAVGN